MAAMARRSSVAPQSPPSCQVPNARRLTLRLLRPNLTCFMSNSFPVETILRPSHSEVQQQDLIGLSSKVAKWSSVSLRPSWRLPRIGTSRAPLPASTSPRPDCPPPPDPWRRPCAPCCSCAAPAESPPPRPVPPCPPKPAAPWPRRVPPPTPSLPSKVLSGGL